MNLEMRELPVLRRLTTLLAAGYCLDDTLPADTVFLRHPARRRMRYWHLMLDSDGRVIGGNAEAELRIRPEEDERFAGFVRTVPKPTWWEAHRDGALRVLAGALPLLLGLCLWGVVQAWRILWGDAT